MTTEAVETVIDQVEKSNSDNTAERYAGAIRVWWKWCNREGNDPFAATSIDVQDYLRYLHNDKGYASSTVGVHMSAINQFFAKADELAKAGHPIPSPREQSPAPQWENPAESASLGNVITDKEDWKTKKERELEGTEGRHGLTEEQVTDLLANLPSPTVRNEAIVKLGYQAMLRRTEVAHLKKGDIDFDNHAITVRAEVAKNGEERTTYYQPSLNSTLKAWIDVDRESYPLATESEYVFLSDQSERVTNRHIGDVFRRASLKCDWQEVLYINAQGNDRLKYSFHSLRHAGAVRRWENGCDLRTLQKLLGHEDISTTQEYLDVSDEALGEKAKATW